MRPPRTTATLLFPLPSHDSQAGDAREHFGAIHEQVMFVRAIFSMPILLDVSTAAPKPMVPAMLGVPASNLCGSSA